jgi:type I restriction enzyme R subunit
MEQINQNEKTLVFCATQDHALAVRDLINQMKTSKDPNYCQRVTANDGALGEQHLLRFSGQRKDHPHDPDHVAETLDRRGRAQHP